MAEKTKNKQTKNPKQEKETFIIYLVELFFFLALAKRRFLEWCYPPKSGACVAAVLHKALKDPDSAYVIGRLCVVSLLTVTS